MLGQRYGVFLRHARWTAVAAAAVNFAVTTTVGVIALLQQKSRYLTEAGFWAWSEHGADIRGSDLSKFATGHVVDAQVNELDSQVYVVDGRFHTAVDYMSPVPAVQHPFTFPSWLLVVLLLALAAAYTAALVLVFWRPGASTALRAGTVYLAAVMVGVTGMSYWVAQQHVDDTDVATWVAAQYELTLPRAEVTDLLAGKPVEVTAYDDTMHTVQLMGSGEHVEVTEGGRALFPLGSTCPIPGEEAPWFKGDLLKQ